MATTQFIGTINPVTKEWAQDVNDFRYAGVFPSGTAAARALTSNLGLTFKVKNYADAGDDYAAITAAVAAVNANGGGVLEFEQGKTYTINHYIESGNGIARATFTGLDGLTIRGNGAKIVCFGGWSATVGRANWGFVIADCSNVRFENLEVDGGSETITKVAAAEQYSHILDVEGCDGVVLENLYFHNGICDGLIINEYGPSTNYVATKNLTAINCRFVKNARQGMSVIQCRGATFINCKFNQTGTAAFGGYSPQAGVDVEPNRYPGMGGGVNGDEFTGDIVFINCEFKDNAGCPYVGTSHLSVIHPITHINSRFINTTGSQRYVNSATKLTVFRECVFDEVDFWPAYAMDYASTTKMYDCKLISSIGNSNAVSMLYNNPSITIEDSEFYLLGTYASISYRIRLSTTTLGNIKFRRNKIFVQASEHDGAGFSTIAQMTNIKGGENEWSTDLATAGRNFYVVYTNGDIKNDYFAQPTYINWQTSAQTENYYSAGTWLIGTNAGLKLSGQTSGAAAATGTLTNAPAAGNPAFWVPIVINGVTRYFPVW